MSNFNFVPQLYIEEQKKKINKKIQSLILITIVFTNVCIANSMIKYKKISLLHRKNKKLIININKRKAKKIKKNYKNIGYIVDICEEYYTKKIPFEKIFISNDFISIEGKCSMNVYRSILLDLEKRKKLKVLSLKYPKKDGEYYKVEVNINER